MKARMVFCMAFRPGFYAALMCAAALLMAATGSSRARDFEMGGDVDYNIMAPEPGTAPRHAVRSERTRTVRGHTQPRTATQSEGPVTDTPEQIETYKRNRRAFASRGSSGIVLPTPVPGPTHYAPIGTSATLHALPQEQAPTILPGSGRAIPNLPHGPETFQDRASRCAFQSSINTVPGGQTSSYIHNCAM
jgi:hypothetical protein